MADVDILVELGFTADEAALANTKNSLNAQTVLVNELINRVAALNNEITNGAKRSIVEEAKLISEFNKAKGALDKITNAYNGQKKFHQDFNNNLSNTTKQANGATIAMTNLGRIVQDAPFGFLGISNNLNPMLESFQRLQKETGGTGSALKALAGELTGAGGIGLALSVATSLLVVFGDKLFSTGDKAEKTNKSMEELTNTITSQITAYAELNSVSADYSRQLSLETELIRARGVVQDQVSKSETDNAQAEKKDLAEKNNELERQIQIIGRVNNVLRSRQKGESLQDFIDKGGFVLMDYNEQKDKKFLSQISEDLLKTEKQGADVVSALYKKQDELRGKIQDNNNKTQITDATNSAKAADRQYQLTKSLNNDIFQLQKELLDKKADLAEKDLDREKDVAEARVLINQAAALRQIDLEAEQYRKTNAAALIATKKIEQDKTAAELSAEQNRLEQLKKLEGYTGAVPDHNAPEGVLSSYVKTLELKKQFADQEKEINSLAATDAKNAGLIAQKRALVDQIAKQELLNINRDYYKKSVEDIAKYYTELNGVDNAQNTRRLSLAQKDGTETLGIRLQQVQNESNLQKNESEKKYKELYKLAKKYNLDIEALNKSHDLELELIEGEARQKELDALDAYYKERLEKVNIGFNAEKARIRFYQGDGPNAGISNAQNDLDASKKRLTETSAEFSRVYNLAISSQGDYSAALEKANTDLFNAMAEVNEKESALYKARVDRVTGEIANYNKTVQAVGAAANAVLDIEISRTDALIREQQRRVDAITAIASEGNAELLKQEKDRLDKLTERQRKYQQEKRAIDAALIISQNLVNVANAVGAVLEAAQKGSKNGGLVGLIVATVGAVATVAAAISSSVAAVKSVSDTGYKKGGYTGDGNENEEAGKVHKQEYVMDAKSTRKLGRKSLEDLRKGRAKIVGVNVDYAGMNRDYDYIRKSRLDQHYDMRRLEGKLDEVKEVISSKPVSSLRADSKGFTHFIESTIAHNNKMKNLG